MSIGQAPRSKAPFGTREHAEDLTVGRHQGVKDAMQWLTFSHLPEQLRKFSEPMYQAACSLIDDIRTDSPELTTALNRLVDAKDAAVRAGIKSDYGRAGSVPRPQTVVDPPLVGNYGTGQSAPRPIRDNPQA